MNHWPQQACTNRVEKVLAERIRHVRSVGDAAALQQVTSMADKENQPQQEYANRAEVLAAMIRSIRSLRSEVVKDFKAPEAG
jgi:phage host-nuclease inhibitor protein Gam